MTMPKTAMNENSQLAAAKHYVRSPRQVANMQAIPIAKTMKKTAHDHLRAGVPSLDAPHALAALFGRQSVRDWAHLHLIRHLALLAAVRLG